MPTIYSKHSFDRFGDDLCEVLLSYLSFEDKFRFECLSKQWKRLVFNKENVIEVNTHLTEDNTTEADLNRLETILKKCSDITGIDVNMFGEKSENKSEVFELFVKHCDHLNAIKADFNDINENTFNRFIHKFGSNLKTIEFYPKGLSENKSVLQFCPNVNQIDVSNASRDLSFLFDGNTLLLKKLKSISFEYSMSDSNRIEVLVENNKNSLQSIDVKLFGSQIDFKYLFNSLPKLLKLKQLSIDFFRVTDKSFVDCLLQMSANCLYVKKIVLTIRLESTELMKKLFKALNSFKLLKRLDLWLNSDTYSDSFDSDDSDVSTDSSETHFPVLRSEALNACKQLTRLSIGGSYNRIVITDEFFTHIDRHLPKLQFFETFKAYVTDMALKSLAKLSDLRSVILDSHKSHSLISESVVLDLIKNCPKISAIRLDNKVLSLSLCEKKIAELRQTIGSENQMKFIEYKDNSDEWETYSESSNVIMEDISQSD